MLVARIAEESDCESVYLWRNHPSTRAHFFNKNSISFSEHKLWFEKVISQNHTLLYIVEDPKGDPLGVVRFDVEVNCAEVHIYLVPDKRGQGYGVRVLDAAIEQLMLKLPINTLLSKVKPENVASVKVFSKAGFVDVDAGLYIKKL